MAQTTFANGRGIIHVTSGGTSTVYPDTCNTPDGSGGSYPCPYSNTGAASNTTNGPTTVTVDKQMPLVIGGMYTKSSGDEAGTYGGVTSGTTQSKVEPIVGSPNVKLGGKAVCLLGESFTQNNKNATG